MKDTKETLIYILKRVLLMIVTFIIIFIICFCLIRLLPIDISTGPGQDEDVFYMMQESLGRMYKGEDGEYYKTPVFQQLWHFIIQNLPLHLVNIC